MKTGVRWMLTIVITAGLSKLFVRELDKDSDRFFAFLNKNSLELALKEMNEYRESGLIAQLDSDMGDTLQRTGSYYTLLHYIGVVTDDNGRPLVEGLQQDLSQLTAEAGIYRRSNKPDYWGYNPDNCSRDQIFAVQSAIVTFRDFDRGRDLFAAFAKRGFLNQNTRANWAYPGDEEYHWKLPDLPTPSQLSLLLRGLGSEYVYPLVFLLDAFIILDIKIFRKSDGRELWDFDIKQLPGLIAANSYLPTIWSRIGLNMYLADRGDIENRINNYHRKEFNGIKPMAEIYIFALEKMDDEINASVRRPASSSNFPEAGADFF